MMPNIDGFSFLRYITHIHPVPVGVTALSSKDGIDFKNTFFSQAKKEGSFVFVANYMTKPFSANEMQEQIDYIFPAIHAKRQELLHFNPTLSSIYDRLEQAYSCIENIDISSKGSIEKIESIIKSNATKSDVSLINIELNKITEFHVEQSKKLDQIVFQYKREKIKSSFLYSLGQELLKVIVIALFIMLLLNFGITDLVKDLIGRVKP